MDDVDRYSLVDCSVLIGRRLWIAPMVLITKTYLTSGLILLLVGPGSAPATDLMNVYKSQALKEYSFESLTVIHYPIELNRAVPCYDIM